MTDSASDKGIVNQLFARRVPQYLGLFIATTWMAVEIGEWVVERFGLPPVTTSYLFIAMIALLPSVALFAWGHGAPGVDRWTPAERFFLPANFIAAIVATLYLVQPGASIAATETKVVLNEEGAEVVLEVAKAEFRRRAIIFFWRNNSSDSSIDWMRYGLPWLLQQDLSQNLFVSLLSPMTRSILSKLRERQITDALDVETSLQIGLARDRNIKHVVDGEFDKVGDQFSLTIHIYDTDTRREREQFTETGPDVLALIDRLSERLLESLGVPEVAGDLGGDLAVADFVSDSLPAIKLLVMGMTRMRLHSDFEGAVVALEQALELDSNLALASKQLAGSKFLMGRTDEVSAHVADALRNGHRLTDADKYNLKGLDYHIKGDSLRRIAVYRLWTERYPNDATAWLTLGEALMLQGSESNNVDALDAFEQAGELDPHNQSIPMAMASIEESLGRPEDALSRLAAYSELFPDDTQPLLKQAVINARMGQFEQATDLLERATLIDSVSLEPGLVLAQLDIYQGKLDNAERRLDQLRPLAQSPEQEAKLLTVQAQLTRQAGRIRDYLDTIMRGDEVLAQFAPPLLRVFSTKFGLILGYALIDDEAAAMVELEAFESAFSGPFAGFANFGYAAYYATTENVEKLEEYAIKSRAFFDEFKFPMLEVNVLLTEGALAEQKGDYTTAVAMFGKLLDMVNQSVLVQMESGIMAEGSAALARVQRLNGQLDDSHSTLDRALIQYPGNPLLLLELAYLEYEEGELKQARATLDEVFRLWSSADEAYIELKKAQSLATLLE